MSTDENSPIDASGVFNVGNTTPNHATKTLPLFSLKGKTAIVTGAGDGIGLGVARALAEAGANVAIWYNNNKSAIDRAQEIANEFGVKSQAYKVEITNYADVEKHVLAATTDLGGRLDVFVANAGVPWTKSAMDLGSDEEKISHYRSVIATDLDGVFYCARAAAKIWRRQKFEGTDINGNPLENFTYGSFVATASMSGHIVNFPQLQAAYNAAKAGVIHLCKSLAVEWVRFARANTISPGYINTSISNFIGDETKNIWRNKTPMGREGEVIELTGAFLYLASDASTYTTGSDIVVDGGYCLP